MDKSSKPSLIKIPRVFDPRGSLSFIQFPDASINAEWMFDIPAESIVLENHEVEKDELIISLSGAFNVGTIHHENNEIFTLTSCYKALNIPAGTQITLNDFVTNSIALIVSEKESGQETAEKTFIDPHPSSCVSNAQTINLDFSPTHFCKSVKINASSPGNIPFDVKRVFYIYDVPADSARGGHSHFEEQQFIVALSGSFDVDVFDGKDKKKFHLDRPYRGLLVPAGLWRTIDNFSGGAVCLVLSSTRYDENDYVREMDRYMELTKNKRQ